ncbi:hypothetical protein N7582_000840 [Saccharomyces uvarum]|uniref:Sterol O-acyltransferase 1 n=2 Tax=Saccharomyces uvarum TaxID=230603 RepID=ARE1_SACU7|nr:RecName: Full=Sterol O-acyltransferase 1; AltName: Full=Sterol-ester synthase 1 [Saccharomyces uvarum CLIB 533]AAO32362.1 ARE1 [Saccharomyces bayanus]WBF11591.1 hypothetical protein N7582_000840 [Saccharomyces uvarum]CAI4057362.1 hypothetical protein SUVC_03G1080 [Saccharomyces uvarum]
MTEAKELLQDERFLKIQELNSAEPSKRHSVTYDNVILPQESVEVSPRSSTTSLEEPATTTATGVAVAAAAAAAEKKKKKKGEDGDDEQDEQAEEKYPVDPRMQKYLSHLKSKSRTRVHRKDASKYVSFFGDVSFDPRPTLLDSAVNVPFQTTFKGPVLEKQLKGLQQTKKGEVAAAAATAATAATAAAAPPGKKLESNFSGIYVFAWMFMGWIAFRSCMDYYVSHEGGFASMEIVQYMTSDLFTIALLDLALFLSTFFVVFVHWLVKLGFIRWKWTGFVAVSLFELCFIPVSFPVYVYYFHFSWVTRIFLFLHSVVLLMKAHSFAFYNGYLWDIKNELEFSSNKLNKFKESLSPETKDILQKSCDFCLFELNYQTKDNDFPNNISCSNYFMFCMFPVLVYQINYPRTSHIRWRYVLEKFCAIMGTIFLMMVTAQIFMHPVAMRCIEYHDTPSFGGWVPAVKQWLFLLFEMIPGFSVLYMLTFYMIWDALLNCVAELTRFADRYFYGDWWNCVSFEEFSRIWNVPVHKFLLRHVYHSSMGALHFSKAQATLFTFLLSAVFHEIAMFAIFKEVRGYLFLFQLSQFAWTALSNTKFLRSRPQLSNVVFTFGVCTGPSMIMTLYLTL